MNVTKFINSIKPKQTEVTLDQSEEDLKLVGDLKKKWDSAVNAKADKVKIWNDCISAYEGEYFKSMSRPDYKSDEISNFIFSTIETIKPIMVDNDPKIIILPKSPEGVGVSEKIQNLFDSEWKRAKMGAKLIQAITVALQIGTSIFYIPWDAKDEKGLGNATPMLINSFNFFPDPMATNMDDGEFYIYGTYKHVNIVKNLFPKVADKIQGGSVAHPELISSGQDSSNVSNQVLILECYLKDYTLLEYEDEEDGTKVKKTKMKYPLGRVVTIAPELNLKLGDKPLAYQDGKFPFKLLKCYDVPFQFWGRSEVEQLLSPQTYINDLTNQIIDNAKLTANMPWVIDKNSGIGKGQLTNRPGLIVRKNPGTQVERKTPPQMPAYVQEMIEVLKRDIEVISGVHDVTQGRKPGSVTAANAIMALQEAAQARIRLKVKLMEMTLSDIGQMWYNRIKQYWVSNRFVRVFDQNNRIDFVEVAPEDLKVEIDFVIEAGSTMPSNKAAMLDLMIRLAQTMAEDGLPMVDRETVLTYTNVPDKNKIVDKFAQITGQHKAEQEQAQQQQLTQQQQMAQQQQTMEMQKEQAMAQADQARNTNSQITDQQIKAIIEMIQQHPEMLQQMMGGMQGPAQEGQ